MEKAKNIIEEYEKGNLEKCLNLYFAKRSLSKEFVAVDQREVFISQRDEIPRLMRRHDRGKTKRSINI